MKSLSIFALVAVMVLAISTLEVSAWCSPFKSGSSMYVCKETGKRNCINVNSGDACINLQGGPFVSGYSAGSHRCTVYSEVGCGGGSHTVDQAGYSRFPRPARSIRCPCV